MVAEPYSLFVTKLAIDVVLISLMWNKLKIHLAAFAILPSVTYRQDKQPPIAVLTVVG